MGPLKTYGRRVVWSCVPLINHFTTAAVAALQHVNWHRERQHFGRNWFTSSSVHKSNESRHEGVSIYSEVRGNAFLQVIGERIGTALYWKNSSK